jgi:adenosylcobinamide-phosphate synthase
MHQDLESALIILAGAVLLDCLLGEYPRFLHPVVWLGAAISGAIRIAPASGWWRQLIFGAILAIGLCAGSVALVWIGLDLSAEHPLWYIGLGIFLLKASMALNALGKASRNVCRLLEEGNLAAARLALCALCSRDPSDLDQEEILEATIESLAENVSDSWVAPLFCYLLFGVPGAVGYRVINTLDAMIGYRGKFEALGKVSARLDDLANWIPARLTAILLLLVGRLGKKDVANGWRILHRDGRKTPSLNGGRPMAAMAGLLNVQLRKKDVYVLGEPGQSVSCDNVRQAWWLVFAAAWLMAFLTGAILGLALHAEPAVWLSSHR